MSAPVQAPISTQQSTVMADSAVVILAGSLISAICPFSSRLRSGPFLTVKQKKKTQQQQQQNQRSTSLVEKSGLLSPPPPLSRIRFGLCLRSTTAVVQKSINGRITSGVIIEGHFNNKSTCMVNSLKRKKKKRGGNRAKMGGGGGGN